MIKIELILFFSLVGLTFKLQAQSETPVSNRSRQSEIGITGGIHASGFYGEKKNDFATYKPFWSYAASVYYKTSISDKLYLGFELEHMNVKSNLTFVKYMGLRSSSTYEALLDLDYINLHFLFGGKLFSINSAVISGTLSPYLGYLLQSKATGHERFTTSYIYSDSLGLHTGFFKTQEDIQKNQTEKVREMNTGMGVSLDGMIPLSSKLALLLKISYNIGIYNVINEKTFIGIRGCVFSVGAVYKLHRKTKSDAVK